MLLLEHNLGRHGIVSAVGFVHSELLLLLFHIEAFDSQPDTIERQSTSWKHNGFARFSNVSEVSESGSTHILGEREAPSLVIPRQLSDAFHLDEELSLKVQELVQTREQEMERVPVEVGHCLVTVFL